MIETLFAKIWNLVIEEIAEIYEGGTFDFLEKKDPEFYEKIQSAEDKVNLHWDKDLDSFKKSVNLWKDLMHQAIREVSEAASKVKKEAPEGRPANIFEKIRGVQEE